MAVRHQLIGAPPERVWEVLADGSRYSEWVVGTSGSHTERGPWPQTGATIEYDVQVGPWTLANETIVRISEPPRVLELEADSGRLGTARIAIEARPWGDETLVIVDEHPLRGLGGTLHNTVLDSLLQVRHRRMLKRLAEVVENYPNRVRTA
ncbi:SRPBCC family protein [Streptomyces sp. NPDC058374]|uniref:SRPBCC family protein n=1 Tax=unclassified Streptomyces TaxID=2593676 RepID=UPI00364AE0E5